MHGKWYRRARSFHADRCRSMLAGMHALVSTKSISLTASKITLVAGEWTLTRMHTLMCSKSIISCATIITFVACVWTIIGMRKLVSSESTADCTSIVAYVAGVWTLPRMNTAVHSEIAAQCTAILALVAGERALTRVRAFVCNKRIFSCTPIIALTTSKRAFVGMNAHVQFESAAVSASMLAFVAGEWSLVELAQCTGQFVCRSMRVSQFSALGIAECWFGNGRLFTDCLISKPCLDVAGNQTSPRHEIARGSSLERPPRRKCRAGGDTGELPRGLEILVRGQRCRGHAVHAQLCQAVGAINIQSGSADQSGIWC